MRVSTLLEARYYHSDLRVCKSIGNMAGHITVKVHSLAWMILAGIVPISIMVYLYSRLVHHLWFKPVQNLEASQRAAQRYRKQVTITLITVSVIYAVCWIPILAGYLERSPGVKRSRGSVRLVEYCFPSILVSIQSYTAYG